MSPADDYTHPIEPHPNFNESMYVNLFDHAQRMGGWFRVGNRPNEGHAEVSACLHFADGSAGFMFQRSEIQGNQKLAAGGLAFKVVKPLEALRVSYDGMLCLMRRPQDMVDPKRAFRSNPVVPCQVAIDLHAISPVFGGETVGEDGRPLEEAPSEAFARAHYEQHVRGTGTSSRATGPGRLPDSACAITRGVRATGRTSTSTAGCRWHSVRTLPSFYRSLP